MAFAEDTTAPEISIGVSICVSDTASVTPWRKTVSQAIVTALARPGHTHIRVMGEAKCGAATVETACSSGRYDKVGPLIICSPATLLALIKLAAWYALEHDAPVDEDYEAFRQRHPPLLAMVSLSAIKDETANKKFESLRIAAEANASDDPRLPIFHSILNLVYAAVLGHEGSHIEAGPPYCSLSSPSRVEESGLWAIIRRVSGSAELFLPQTPVVGEVAADRCATRRLRFARDALERSNLARTEQEFVRRASADIISGILLLRLPAAGAKPSIEINESYLYPPLRIAALASELSLSTDGPVICGGAAEDLVEAVQFTLKNRLGNGLIPDEIEHLFPKGVIDAWNGNASWSKESFACR